MTTINWKRKLSSRKLWAAVAGIVTGLAMIFGLDENTISTVAGAVVSVASVVAYVITEGKVDAESVKNVVENVESAVEVIQGPPGPQGPMGPQGMKGEDGVTMEQVNTAIRQAILSNSVINGYGNSNGNATGNMQIRWEAAQDE